MNQSDLQTLAKYIEQVKETLNKTNVNHASNSNSGYSFKNIK